MCMLSTWVSRDVQSSHFLENNLGFVACGGISIKPIIGHRVESGLCMNGEREDCYPFTRACVEFRGGSGLRALGLGLGVLCLGHRRPSVYRSRERGSNYQQVL